MCKYYPIYVDTRTTPSVYCQIITFGWFKIITKIWYLGVIKWWVFIFVTYFLCCWNVFTFLSFYNHPFVKINVWQIHKYNKKRKNDNQSKYSQHWRRKGMENNIIHIYTYTCMYVKGFEDRRNKTFVSSLDEMMMMMVNVE